jgi:hypothetical protein
MSFGVKDDPPTYQRVVISKTFCEYKFIHEDFLG